MCLNFQMQGRAAGKQEHKSLLTWKETQKSSGSVKEFGVYSLSKYELCAVWWPV